MRPGAARPRPAALRGTQDGVACDYARHAAMLSPATRIEQKRGGVEGAEGAFLTAGGCCCANDSLALK